MKVWILAIFALTLIQLADKAHGFLDYAALVAGVTFIMWLGNKEEEATEKKEEKRHEEIMELLHEIKEDIEANQRLLD